MSKEVSKKCSKVSKIRSSVYIVLTSIHKVSNSVHGLPDCVSKCLRIPQMSSFNHFHTLSISCVHRFKLENIEIFFRILWASWNPCPSLTGLVEPFLATHRVVGLVHQLTFRSKHQVFHMCPNNKYRSFPFHVK